MIRAVLSLGGLLAVVWVIVMVFGYTTPQTTALTPALNRSVLHTVELETARASEGNREPSAPTGPSAPAPSAPSAPAPPTPSWTPEVPVSSSPAASSSQTAEIIGPDSTAHLNPDHLRDVTQPVPAWALAASGDSTTFNPNPAAFVPPNPLPAHPRWTWEVQNREFTDVAVTHVDADVVAITSDSGPARIEIGLLPQELRQALHYDPALAAEAAAARKNAAPSVTSGAP